MTATTSVLLCGISSADVTIHFTSSILRMQTELMRTPGVNVSFEFFRTVDDALTHFHSATTCDACVVIDGQLSVEPGFVLEHDAAKPFTVASYPLRTVDWERIRSKITTSSEPASHVGIKYNYDPTLATPEPGGAHLKIPAHSEVQLKIFKITRDALDTIINKHKEEVQGEDGSLAIYTTGIVNGKKLSPDQRFIHLWGDPLYADVSRKTKNVGPYDFTGAVGNHRQLR
jgi:hypothetical protein